jgi:hypothetical protein
METKTTSGSGVGVERSDPAAASYTPSIPPSNPSPSPPHLGNPANPSAPAQSSAFHRDRRSPASLLGAQRSWAGSGIPRPVLRTRLGCSPSPSLRKPLAPFLYHTPHHPANTLPALSDPVHTDSSQLRPNPYHTDYSLTHVQHIPALRAQKNNDSHTSPQPAPSPPRSSRAGTGRTCSAGAGGSSLPLGLVRFGTTLVLGRTIKRRGRGPR